MGRIRSTNQVGTEGDQTTVEPPVDALLINWGRWARGGGASATSTGVWRFAARGTRAAAYHGAPTVVPIDVAQARAVEAVVCATGFSPLFRGLLRAHYVQQTHQARTCRELGIVLPAYEHWVWRATMHFAERWAQRVQMSDASA